MDLSQVARDGEYGSEPPTSEVRPLVPPFAIPWLMVTLDGLRALPLDPRTAFLVSLVDGQCSVEMIADVAGMAVEEAAAVFAKLLLHGVVELRDPK